MQPIIDISWWQLSFLLLILLIPIYINWHFKLGLSRDTALSVARMIAQLILVGFYLQYLFSLNNVLLNLFWLFLMMVIGASAIIKGATLNYQRCYMPVLAGVACGLVPLLMILIFGIIEPTPYYSAQYLIPLAGMLLGNSLSGNIVALQHLFNGLEDKHIEYQSYLALGASPAQATREFVQRAIRQSLTPMLASMSTTGLVTLPGMMTGQILSGVNPMIAIKYQLIIMLAIFVMLTVSISVSLILTVRSSIGKSGEILL